MKEVAGQQSRSLGVQEEAHVSRARWGVGGMLPCRRIGRRALTDRILFLEGLPNYQRLFHVRVGQTVTEMFRADKQIEREAIDRLPRGIEVMRAKGDITSANIFESILADEEHHIHYLDAQLELIESSVNPSTSRR